MKAISTTFERSASMQIRTRFSIGADGYVTTPDGWPALVADPSFVSGQSHGFPEFQRSCEAVLMGRTTFEPALTNDRWPWPDLDVFVLPILLGDGMRLTPALNTDTRLTLESERPLPGGSVEIIYACA
jgi:hypothetical protein